MKKTREQMGSLYPSHGTWFVRYYEKDTAGTQLDVSSRRRTTKQLGSMKELTRPQ